MSKVRITLGPLIEGTMKPVDIIPKLINECFRRSLSYAHIINATSEQWPMEMCMGRALMVVGGSKDGDKLVQAITNHDWWNKDLDNDHGWTNHEENAQTQQELIDLLNEGLAGATFGTHHDDPACLGYWAEPNGDERGDGIRFEWQRMHPGLELRLQHETSSNKDYNNPDNRIFFQGEDMERFLTDIGAVDFIWMNDPKNTEGRVFKTIEEHYDAIMDPYFGNE